MVPMVGSLREAKVDKVIAGADVVTGKNTFQGKCGQPTAMCVQAEKGRVPREAGSLSQAVVSRWW